MGVKRPHPSSSSLSCRGLEAAEIEALFSLYGRLQELCEDRIARNTDPNGGQLVEDVLRYRLTRLVTGETWDSQPALKLRVLQLMFACMVRENERLMEESRDVPSLKLGRGLSLNRGRSRDIGPRRKSKWAESISEIGRMQGQRLLPLVKLLLLENAELKACASPSAGETQQQSEGGGPPTPGLTTAGPAQGGSSIGESTAHVPAATAAALMDDLLGLTGSGEQDASEAASRRSSSPTPSSAAATEDPFANLAESRRSDTKLPRPPAPATPSDGSSNLMAQFASMSVAAAAGPGGAYPGQLQGSYIARTASPAPSYGSQSQASSVYGVGAPYSLGPGSHTAGIPTGATCHFGPSPGNQQSWNMARSDSSSLPPPSPVQHIDNSPLQFRGSIPTGEFQRPPVGNERVAHVMAFESNFEAASPYLVSPNITSDNYFRHVWGLHPQ